MPAATVASIAAREQVRIFERCSIGVRSGIAKFPALMNRGGILRGCLAGDAPGKRKLPE